MTPEESNDLVFLGSLLYSNLLGGSIFTCLLFGLYILTFLIALYTIITKGIQGRPRRILWSCIMILLVCNIWNFANYTIITIVDIKTTFMASENLDTTIDAYYINLAKVDIVDNLPFDISLVIGDGIVAWRAWVIWRESRLARYLLAILMVGNIATNTADFILDVINDSNQTITMDDVSSSFSLAVNLLATMLIAFKAWGHRQTLRMISANKTRHTRVEKVLLLLVESGVVYCSIQALYLIIQIFTIKSGQKIGLLTWTIGIGMLADVTAVLYPLAIFLVLNLDQSPLAEAFISSIVLDETVQESTQLGIIGS